MPIQQLKDLDKSKVQEAIDKYGVDKVKNTLTDRWLIQPKMTTPTGTSWISTVKTTETKDLTPTTWYKEWQVWIPWVNLIKKPWKIGGDITPPQDITTGTTWTTSGVWSVSWTDWGVSWTAWTTEWKTGWVDVNKDWVMQGDELSWKYKTFYDSLTQAEKKQFEAVWLNAQKQWQDITQAYINYMEDYNTAKTRREEDEATRLKIKGMTDEMTQIQESQTLRKAKQSVDKLKQSVAYLWSLGMPWVSQARITWIEAQLKEADTTYQELVRLQDLASSAREQWDYAQARQFERDMDDLNNKLNDNIDKQIQEAYNALVSQDQSGKLDTLEEVEAFRMKLLTDLDNSITWIADASIQQRQFLIDRYDNIVLEKRQFEANKGIINTDLSQINWYYTDMNWDPIISATTWQRVNIPAESPMEPVFDKNTGRLITFWYDENGNITTNVDQVYDNATVTEKAINSYADLVNRWVIDLNDIPQEIRNSVVEQMSWLEPYEKAITWEWTKLNEYQLFNKNTGQIMDTVTNQIVWQMWTEWLDYSQVDFSTNQKLINKYQWEASFKNNNPAWLTWGISNNLKNLFDEAGINYSMWTPRPKDEWWNYIKFASVQDWLDAYFIALTQAWSQNVQSRLATWVWTVDTASNNEYAKEIMQKAWIPINQDIMFSDLNDNQLSKLMEVQMQREALNFYNELMSYEPDKWKEWTIWTLWVPISYERQIKQMVPPTLMNSEVELEALNETIKQLYKAWLDVEDAVLTYLWFNVEWTNKQNALSYINVWRNLGEDLPDNYYATISNYINKWDEKGADKYVSNIVEDKAKKRYWDDLITTSKMNMILSDTIQLNKLISQNPEKIWAFDGRVTQFMKKFKDYPEMQKLNTLLTMKQADVRKYFAGSAVTETEMKALEDFIWGNIKMTPNNLVTILNTIKDRTEKEYLSQRKQFWFTPRLKVTATWEFLDSNKNDDPLGLLNNTETDPLGIFNQ